jgi:hypothetical protein
MAELNYARVHAHFQPSDSNGRDVALPRWFSSLGVWYHKAVTARGLNEQTNSVANDELAYNRVTIPSARYEDSAEDPSKEDM